MKYNFDEVINREGTNSMKWDYQEEMAGQKGVLPLWIADMDFAIAPFIAQSVQKRAAHAIYGYAGEGAKLFSVAKNWINNRYGTNVQTEWITTTPGVVPGLYFALEAFTEIGDEVIIQPPIYPPFFSVIRDKKRKVVENPLMEKDGYFTIDFDHLESVITEKTKVIIFCNPHNPVGRAWTREEQERLAEICLRHNIIIVSDEIHADLVYERRHIPTFSISEQISQQCLTFMSGSKSFNIAGLFTSIAFSENEQLMKKFKVAVQRSGAGFVHNLFGIEALTAAYEHGEEWLEQLLEYLHGNAHFIANYLKENIPSVKMTVPQSTYLAWLDFRELGLEGEELNSFLMNEAKLWLNMGETFGKEGSGYARMNFGCPRCYLEEAMKRLEQAVRQFNKR